MTDLHLPFSRAGIRSSADVADEPTQEDPLFKRIHELIQSVTIHIQRGAELEKAGRLDEAIREHEAALAIDPNHVQVHANLCRCMDAVEMPLRPGSTSMQ